MHFPFASCPSTNRVIDIDIEGRRYFNLHRDKTTKSLIELCWATPLCPTLDGPARTVTCVVKDVSRLVGGGDISPA